MPDTWLPGAHRDPGRNAGYNSGRNRMLRAVAHFTVGADSRSVGQRGFFHFLVHRSSDRENGLTQYAEVDAITWHAADQGNPYGPGIEWERMVTGPVGDNGLSEAEPLTDNQIAWGQKLVAFLAEWGIETRLYDGPRFAGPVMPGGRYCGWVNHQAIDRDRSDGLSTEEFAQLTTATAPVPSPIEDEEDMSYFVASTENPDWGIYLCDGIGLHHVPNPRAVDELVRTGVVKNHDVKQINADGWTALISYDQVWGVKG